MIETFFLQTNRCMGCDQRTFLEEDVFDVMRTAGIFQQRSLHGGNNRD